jgi:Domain of unknown function (DUF4279)
VERPDLSAEIVSRWEVKVKLLFLGSNNVGPEFDPAELTTLIGVTPDRQWRTGDPGQFYPKRTCGWELDSSAGPTAPLSRHVDCLLQTLRGHEAAFAEAAGKFRVQLECVIASDADTVSPELVVPLDQLRALTDLGIAAIGLDIHEK